MLKKRQISFLLILLTYYVGYGQGINTLNLERKTPKDSIDFIQIKTDSLFNSKQIISLLALQKNLLTNFALNLVIAIWI
jgi:hypothetical protein